MHGEDKWFDTFTIIIVGKGDLFLYITCLISVSVSRRKVLFCLFWTPRPSLSWAEQRSPSISRTGPTACLTTGDRCATVCSSLWQKLLKLRRQLATLSTEESTSVDVFACKMNCKRKSKRNKKWEKTADSCFLFVPP